MTTVSSKVTRYDIPEKQAWEILTEDTPLIPMVLASDYDALKTERDALASLVENWKGSASQFERNADFYRSIVSQIGELFGEEARTSDDGSVQDDVLALKVPELVRALQVERDALAAHVRSKDDDPK